MTVAPTPKQLEALRAFDVPTICNGLEAVDPRFRLHAYTREPLYCFQLLASRVTPSHAWVHAAGSGEKLRVAGLEVASGDLIYADRHCAVNIPVEFVQPALDAIEVIQTREAVIVGAACAPGLDYEKLARAIRDADEIH